MCQPIAAARFHVKINLQLKISNKTRVRVLHIKTGPTKRHGNLSENPPQRPSAPRVLKLQCAYFTDRVLN